MMRNGQSACKSITRRIGRTGRDKEGVDAFLFEGLGGGGKVHFFHEDITHPRP